MCCLSITYTTAQTSDLHIDLNTRYQHIDGFGASDAWRCQFVGQNWPVEKREQMAEWLFSKELDEKGNPKGIGLSIWRFYVSAGSAEQGELSGIKNEWRRGQSFIDADGNYNWNKQLGQQWFLNKAKEAGVDKFLAFSIAAPTFWSLNGKAYAATQNGTINLKPEKFDDYAKFMTNVLKHFEEIGIHFDYLSPINEPQWDWEKASQEGTPATNKNMKKLISMLNTYISDANLNTDMVIGEAADLRFLYSEYGKPERAQQLQAFYDKDNSSKDTYIRDLSNVSNTVSGHSYFTTWPVSSLIDIRKELHQSLDSLALDYWQSEFCILENSEDLGGGGGTRDLGMATALYVARVIHADLTLLNAKSWQWWTALTIADYKDGLIYLDTGNEDDMYNREALKYDGNFHDSKLMWALGNYSRFVKPGMQRVASIFATNKSMEDKFKDLMISSYIGNQGEMVVVAINYSDEEKQIVLKNDSIIIDAAYETSNNKNLEFRSVTNKVLKLTPKSVTTFTGILK